MPTACEAVPIPTPIATGLVILNTLQTVGATIAPNIPESIIASTVTGVNPPKFTFQVNNKGLIHFSYERYLENKIRENFDFSGTPIILQFKNKSEK